MSEDETRNEYKVFPSAGLVIGLQYKGQLATIKGKTEIRLATAGITGISDSYKLFKSSPNIGTVLIFFTEVGFTHFTSHPANELFNLSVSLDEVFGKLIIEAVKLIYQNKGAIRIKEVNERLFISQSPFEKRFRNVVGTTPKKFASIIRFNAVLENLDDFDSLTQMCYENYFFDQARFTKDFKQFTGETPINFKRFMKLTSH